MKQERIQKQKIDKKHVNEKKPERMMEEEKHNEVEERNMDKLFISNQIKPITKEQVDAEFAQLTHIGCNAYAQSPRSKIGNNVVDYFTFTERLETRGKYGISFYEFLQQIDRFREKKFINTMLHYYKTVKNKNHTKNEYVVYKEVYNICISAINIMRPLTCMEIYSKYHAKRVLNCCAGWGGSCVAAAALSIEAHIGLDINASLQKPYERMVDYLQTKCDTQLQMTICDAVTFDYSTIQYDMVFSSPPYYSIEKYEHNQEYASKREMDELFYKPLFTNTYRHLLVGGHFVINICKEVYEQVLRPLLGEARETFPLKKSKRQNNHTELVYVWCKSIV